MRSGPDYLDSLCRNIWIAEGPGVVATAAVPELATVILFSTGLAGFIGSRVRRKKWFLPARRVCSQFHQII